MPCAPFRVLEISDGCTTVDLMNPKGLFCTAWTPRITAPKGGGSWRDSSLAHGRRLAMRKRQNVSEGYTIQAMGLEQDAVIREMQTLRRLLEKAVNYWITDWQNEVVWIRAQGAFETNDRYTVIHDYRTLEDDYPYGGSFERFVVPGAGFKDIPLVVEHAPTWTAEQPGTGTATEISAVETYDCGPYHLEFDGADSIVNCGNDATIQDIPDGADITVDGWVRSSSTGEGSLGVIIQKATNTSLADGWCLRVHTNGLEGRVNAVTDASSRSGTDDFDPTDEVWHHVLMTYDEAGAATPVAQTVYLAIDGVWVTSYQLQTTGVGAYDQDTARDLCIGNVANVTRTFDGDIGWVRVSDNVRYTVNTDFTAPLRCSLPAIDVNTVAQWIGAEESGATIDNQEGDSNNDGTQADCVFDCDCDRNLGNVDEAGVREPTTADEVYVANKRNVANLTHVFTWSAANLFSGNLMDAALPYDLIDEVGAAPAVDDYVVFIIDTSLADSGPFCSLVTNIGTAGAGYTGHWEFWDTTAGPGWAALTVQDNTDQDGAMTGETFDTTGVNSIHWVQDSDWVTNTVNTVTGYAVRYVLDTVPGPHTSPTQQNRDVYSVVSPYVEIDDEQIAGDISALLEVKFRNHSDNSFGTFDPELWASRVIVGLRSLSRGGNFTAYLNASDEQNPTGVTVTAGLTGVGAFVNDVQSPTGRVILVLNAAAVWLIEATWILTSSLANHYIGTFHAFLRASQTSGALGDIRVRLQVATTGAILYDTTESQSFPTLADFAVIDLGQITVPPSTVLTSADVTGTVFNLEVSGNESADLVIYDLILIPIDEWAGDFVDTTGAAIGGIGNRSGTPYDNPLLDIDSVFYPKYSIRALQRNYTDDGVGNIFESITAGPAMLQANVEQRLWFFCTRQNTDVAPFEVVDSALAVHNVRYLSMRGDR